MRNSMKMQKNQKPKKLPNNRLGHVLPQHGDPHRSRQNLPERCAHSQQKVQRLVGFRDAKTEC